MKSFKQWLNEGIEPNDIYLEKVPWKDEEGDIPEEQPKHIHAYNVIHRPSKQHIATIHVKPSEHHYEKDHIKKWKEHPESRKELLNSHPLYSSPHEVDHLQVDYATSSRVKANKDLQVTGESRYSGPKINTGIRALKSIYNSLKEKYPNAKTFSGTRDSGIKPDKVAIVHNK